MSVTNDETTGRTSFCTVCGKAIEEALLLKGLVLKRDRQGRPTRVSPGVPKWLRVGRLRGRADARAPAGHRGHGHRVPAWAVLMPSSCVEVVGGPNDGMRIELDVLAHWLVLPVEREVTLLPPSQALSLEATVQYWRLPIRGGRAWWAKRTGPHDTP